MSGPAKQTLSCKHGQRIIIWIVLPDYIWLPACLAACLPTCLPTHPNPKYNPSLVKCVCNRMIYVICINIVNHISVLSGPPARSTEVIDHTLSYIKWPLKLLISVHSYGPPNINMIFSYWIELMTSNMTHYVDSTVTFFNNPTRILHKLVLVFLCLTIFVLMILMFNIQF